MEEVLDKLGAYDLFVILMSGLLIWGNSIIWIIYVLGVSIPAKDNLFFTLPFLFLQGYMIGILFQEIGNLIYKMMEKKAEYVKLVYQKLDPEIKRKIEEHTLISKSSKKDCVQVYSYAKMCVYHCDCYDRVEKGLVSASMSRSMCLFFFLSLIGTLLYLLNGITVMKISYIVYSFVAMCLFYRRWIRYVEFRIKEVFKSFYIYVISKK